MMGKYPQNNAVPRAVVILTVLTSLALLLCVFNVKPAFGEEARLCAEDIANFCKDIRPGGGRIITCLKKHEGDLTPPCRDKLQQVLKRLEEAKRACANDIEEFCKDVQEGEGRIARCLGEHGPGLSPECAKHVEWVKAKAKDK